jgi:hypothetical protein
MSPASLPLQALSVLPRASFGTTPRAAGTGRDDHEPKTVSEADKATTTKMLI